MTKKSIKSAYKLAFMEAMGCKSSEFEMKPYIPKSTSDTSILAKYKDEIYSIQTYQDIENTVTEFISYPDSADLLDPYAVSDGFFETDIHLDTEFYQKLLPKLTQEESIELSLTLGIFNTCKNIDFWLLLYDNSHWGMYGKATHTAIGLMEAEQKKLVIDDIVSYMIYGSEENILLSPMNIGPIENIVFNEDEPNQEDFYIYQVETNYWDKDLLKF